MEGRIFLIMIRVIMMNSVIEIQLAVVRKMKECYPNIRAAYFIDTKRCIIL